MSSTEIPSDFVERIGVYREAMKQCDLALRVYLEAMKQRDLALGVYGRESLKQRDLVQHGKKLCGLIHSSAEKCSLPTDLLGPEFSPTVDLTDEWQPYMQKYSFKSTLYRSRLHIEALQVREYLGKFIDYSVKETSKYYDCLVKLPKELYDEFVAIITVDYAFGTEISSIDDQLMKLTEMVTLASDHQEIATALEGIGYHLILLTAAMETNRRLEKFMKPQPPPSVVFLRSREEILEDTVPLSYATGAHSHYSWMDPKVVESYVIDIPERRLYDIYNMRWHEEMHGLKDALKNVRKTDHMAIISSSILAMTAQAGGSFLSSAFADHTSNRTSKWALDFVEAAMLAGFGLTIGGMGIRRMKPEISGVMIKSGAIATAGAFIASMAMPLSPAVAWTVGPIAAGFVAISIGLA